MPMRQRRKRLAPLPDDDLVNIRGTLLPRDEVEEAFSDIMAVYDALSPATRWKAAYHHRNGRLAHQMHPPDNTTPTQAEFVYITSADAKRVSSAFAKLTRKTG